MTDHLTPAALALVVTVAAVCFVVVNREKLWELKVANIQDDAAPPNASAKNQGPSHHCMVDVAPKSPSIQRIIHTKIDLNDNTSPDENTLISSGHKMIISNPSPCKTSESPVVNVGRGVLLHQ
ncbi:UNVERIFIED_CONTAM: hypothetical protein HDU68_012510 [Siphonaria sp. JEL0065]|nr:hypothetical protein HDU68_012510 [Siphonaria sp. JEL0065]